MNHDQLINQAEKITGPDQILNQYRKFHLEGFKRDGFKELTIDSYKFTRPEHFFSKATPFMESACSEKDFSASTLPTLIFKDGEFVAETNIPEGVTVKKTFDHFTQVKDLFEETGALSSLHHALSKTGVFLEIKPNVRVDSPIRLVHLLNKAELSTPTHVVVAGAHSQVTILEETRSLETGHTLISETFILAQDGAQVEHISLDETGSVGTTHSSLTARVQKDASVRSLIFHGKGNLHRKNLILHLNSPGAHGESYALYLTDANEHSDIFTTIHHHAADTTSRQKAKGILDGSSRGIFTGKIHIHPKAQRVSSEQLNKNLLLSPKAQAHSQPQLEIFADDVKCSHGSTTGELSDDEVFYFQARGIPRHRARIILAQGFALEIVQKIQNKIAYDYVLKVIENNLRQKFSLGNE